MSSEDLLRRLYKAKGVKVVGHEGSIPPPPPPEYLPGTEWVTASEAAKRWGISRQRVHQLLSRGDAPLSHLEDPRHPYRDMPRPLPHGVPELYKWHDLSKWRDALIADRELKKGDKS